MSTLRGGMCSICCHMALVLAYMHLYSIFNLRLLLSILFYHFFQSGIETPDQNGHLLTLLPFFYESNTEGTNFWTMFYVYVKCMFYKSPEVTLCGCSINKEAPWAQLK